MIFNQTQNLIDEGDDRMTGSQIILKSAISGGVCSVVYMALNDPNLLFTFDVKGKSIPGYQAVAGIGAAASIATSYASEYYFSHWKHNEKSKHIDSLIGHIALQTVGMAAIPRFVSDLPYTASNVRQFALIGAVGESISSIVYDLAHSM